VYWYHDPVQFVMVVGFLVFTISVMWAVAKRR